MRVSIKGASTVYRLYVKREKENFSFSACKVHSPLVELRSELALSGGRVKEADLHYKTQIMAIIVFKLQ